MAVLKIRQFGDPVLRERAHELEKVTDVHMRLIADMLDTMRSVEGVGLAGNQVGVVERIFVWQVEDRHGAVINPRITTRSSTTDTAPEGCLSMPGLTYEVERPAEVTIEGLDESGEPIEIAADGLLARVFQHETDHLDGILFIDRLPDETRREALATLRDQALGLPVSRAPENAEQL